MAVQITIPVVIEKVANASGHSYEVQPVFDPNFNTSDRREDQAIERATQALRRRLSALVRDCDHGPLSEFAFCPELARHTPSLTLRLRKQTFTGKFLFVAFRVFERRLFYCPKMPQLCFEVNRGENLEYQATEFLTNYFRTQEKDQTGIEPIDATTELFSRISYISIETNVLQSPPRKPRSLFFADLGPTEKLDGAEELESTGRCINRLHPRRIQRAILQDQVVETLYKNFAEENLNKRPVVLVGPSQVGKTCIIHELVARRIESKEVKRDHLFWLLNPQRLISGMQYVGQWENRLLAILTFVTKKKHILYFDDLLGLFQAGKTRDSNLSVADLLKNHIEQSPTRIIAEATPEQWRLFKEKDRSLADLFEVIPVTESSEKDTQRILIRVLQKLEIRHKCQFSPEVIPTVIKLQKRYIRTRSFPGKAAEFIEQLASKSQQEISRQDAILHFQEKSGMNMNILNDQNGTKLLEKIRESFRNQIVGQEAALSAMEDTLLMVTSKLNDTSRPITSLLFLGPTGVGKTECAKALAEILFNSKERLIRFDMNEYVDASATNRLLGNDLKPQGLLTTAVKRNPFSVVLLDEIEKAHPSVFDLLLQLLGEGRLTDAAGQTADFCNCIIILTSNLGSKANASQLGFVTNASGNEKIYCEAAEKFFRPELFNRLDKIIPFHELERSHIASMVKNLTLKSIDRFGIKQLKTTLNIEDSVLEFLTDKGFDPEYGARTLRRSIETYLIQPLAHELADTETSSLGSMTISMKEDLPFITKETYLEPPRQYNGFTEISDEEIVNELIDSAYDFMDRVEDTLQEIREELDNDLKSKQPYYHLLEQLDLLKSKVSQLEDEFEIVIHPHKTTALPAKAGRRSTNLHLNIDSQESILDLIEKSGDPAKFLREITDDAELQSWLAYRAEQLILSINFLSYNLEKKINTDTVDIEASMDTSYVSHYLKSLGLLLPDLSAKLENGTTQHLATTTHEPIFSNHNRLTHLQGEGVRYPELIEFCQGIHLEFDASGNINHTSIGSKNQGSQNTLIISHREASHVLDLRTGIIQEKNHFSLFTHIAPLLPMAPELRTISAQIYSHG